MKMKLREDQVEIFHLCTSSCSKVIGVKAPTGFGKTITYLAITEYYTLSGKKVVISSFTKQLQKQIVRQE